MTEIVRTNVQAAPDRMLVIERRGATPRYAGTAARAPLLWMAGIAEESYLAVRGTLLWAITAGSSNWHRLEIEPNDGDILVELHGLRLQKHSPSS
jgi:hypothetical protein